LIQTNRYQFPSKRKQSSNGISTDESRSKEEYYRFAAEQLESSYMMSLDIQEKYGSS
jgi:hypothetical protein